MAAEHEEMELSFVRHHVGPPFYDEYTAEELPAEEVAAGLFKELDKMREMGVFEEVSRSSIPPDAQVVDSRLVMHRKSPEEVRVRLVARELNDGSRRDFFNSTPTAMAIPLLLMVATFWQWPVLVADVCAAFLHAPVVGLVYIVLPPGIVPPDVAWRLKKALYGLRESPRLWGEYLAEQLGNLGWHRVRSEPQLFVHSSLALLVAHVDDFLLTGPRELLPRLQAEIDKVLVMKWLGEIADAWRTYLSRQYKRVGASWLVRVAPSYAVNTLKLVQMQTCKGGRVVSVEPSPMNTSIPLTATAHSIYRTVTGRLMWYAATRPDLLYAVKELARHVSAPCEHHYEAMKRLLRFLRATVEDVWILQFSPSHRQDVRVTVQGTADASWGSTPGYKSTSGGIVDIDGFVVSVWARTQHTISLSSAEAELISLSLAAQESLFIRTILDEIGFSPRVVLRTDSTAALSVPERRGVGRMRHLALRLLWLQDLLRRREVEYQHVTTALNAADLMTKSVKAGRLEVLRRLLGVQPVQTTAAGCVAELFYLEEGEAPGHDWSTELLVWIVHALAVVGILAIFHSLG